jgi:NitT/TauT family transport system ATP-binding protein
MVRSSEQNEPAKSEVDCCRLVVEFQPGRQVLDGLDLQVQRGEIVALLGKSGCGKSTVLRCVAGLQPLVSGSVTIDGLSPQQARRRLSFVFQEPSLLPWRSAHRNVGLPLEMGSDRSLVQERIARTLEAVGFHEEDWSKLPRQLSGGMKMRASLARALITDPMTMLLDEPFAALDDLLRGRMNELLLQLWTDHPRTMLFVTHNIAEAVYLSHRIAIMNRGKIVNWIDNPLSWPRVPRLRGGMEFAQVYARVSSALADTA